MSTAAPGVTLGFRLLMARKKAKLEQADLAMKAGVSQATVSRWERGLSEPKPSHLERVAEATDTPYTWLMGADDLSTRFSTEQGALFGEDDEPAWDFTTPVRVFPLADQLRRAS